MTAKEWIFENYPQVKKEWNKTGHDDNYMVRMMEEYHQAKLKLLGIADVVGHSEQLKCEHRYSTNYPVTYPRKCTKCGEPLSAL